MLDSLPALAAGEILVRFLNWPTEFRHLSRDVKLTRQRLAPGAIYGNYLFAIGAGPILPRGENRASIFGMLTIGLEPG